MKAIFFYIFTCIVLWVMNASSVYGQGEAVFASTDQRVYIAGERIWVFGKFLQQDSLNNEELSVYLLDRNAAVVSKHKTMTISGNFFTGIPIKPTAVTDNYVVALARNNICIEFLPLMIINPVIAPLNTENQSELASQNTVQSISTLDIRVDGNEKKQREMVQVNLPRTGLSSDYFVNVYREDALSAFADSLFVGWSFKYEQNKERSQTVSGEKIKTADQGFSSALRVNVTVLDPAGKPAADIPILTSLLGSQSDLGYAATNTKGEAEIIHPFHYADPAMIITPLSGKEGLKIILADSKDSFSFKLGLPALQLRPYLKPAMDARITNASVFNAYAPESKLKLLTSGLDTTDFYGIPDKRYVLDDFKRFPDMQEVIQEFIPEVRVKKNQGKAILQVVNLPYKQFFEQGALVLLDGVPVIDIDQLLALDPLKMYSIEVVGRKFFLGHLQIHGIVHYKTYKSDLGGYKLSASQLVTDFKGLELPRVPAYGFDADPRMPDMRNTIFLAQPSDITGQQFRFSTLDVLGNYMIRVTSVDANGNIQTGRKQISVK
jgi:hypothetical protein